MRAGRDGRGGIPGPALVGLLTAQLVAMANATLVLTAAPTMIRDLRGSDLDYTWLLAATILTMTAATPIWSRLADVRSPKLLLQVATAVFVVGAVVAGTATSPAMLVAGRGVQGVGVGGITALVQVVIALMASPRYRGRYTAWIAAVQLVAMLAGPLAGGLLVQTPVIGWRGSFLVGVPLAVVAAVLVELALRVPRHARASGAAVDYAGAVLVTVGISLLLVWVSFQGVRFPVLSPASLALVTAAAVILTAAIAVEVRAPAPVLPVRLLRGRAILLSTVATAAVGASSFATPMLVTRYLQSGRGVAPALSGLILASMAAGTVVSSFLVAAVAARTARLKACLVVGSVALTLTATLLATATPTTPFGWVALLLFLHGCGLGATMQFFAVVVQNDLPVGEIGAGTGMVTFVRSLAGTLAMTGIGAYLSGRVDELRRAGAGAPGAYATGSAQSFAVLAVVLALGALVVAVMPVVRLRDSTTDVPPFGEADHGGA